MNKEIAARDKTIINFMQRISLPLARFSIFIIFFWFGLLKVVHLSPANAMVIELLHKTLFFMDPITFLFYFGIYEMIIGITFLIPRVERLSIALLLPHLISTALPLFLLTHLTWSGFLVPTLEGQYIIKNILIAALAISIAASLKPMNKTADK